MKIGILTHPIIKNYGGILQAFSLKCYIESLGHNVIILDRRFNYNRFKGIILDLLEFLNIPRYSQTKKECSLISKFIKKHFIRTHKLYSKQELVKEISKHKLECVIIGSDQVWRSDFCNRCDYDYWGGFILYNKNVKVFSYAASIAHNTWNYSEEDTINIKALISNFCGVSVREESAVHLCKQYLNIDAKWVIDPTLLHDHTFYDKIATKRIISKKYIFVYWLGERDIINKDLEQYSRDYEIIELHLSGNNKKISIEEWLSYIKYSDIVITDSFHGTVFSIIYNKHFITYRNDSGGYSRIESLFKLLNIEEKINNPHAILDYRKVEIVVEELRKNAQAFIQESIRCSL